jgi:phosphinothricin acetyltransferase
MGIISGGSRTRRNGLIRNALKSDAEAICRIYNHYVLNTVITFEEEPLNPTEIAARIGEYTL